MDQELVSLLQSPDRETALKGAQMLAAFLSKASFPSKAVQALREVTEFAAKLCFVQCNHAYNRLHATSAMLLQCCMRAHHGSAELILTTLG